MSKKTYVQKVLQNEGNNTQSGNIFDFKNANIGIQNNYYQSKDNIFEILIDNNQIKNWHKNNLINIDNLLHLFLNLKFEYIQNNNINIVVKTSRLQSLDEKFKKTKNFEERHEIIKNIEDEKNKCNQIKILLKIINLDVLNINDINSQKIIFEILHILCNNPIDQKEPWQFQNEPIKIHNFLQDIECISCDNRVIDFYIKKWDKENNYPVYLGFNSNDDEYKRAKRLDEEREEYITALKKDIKNSTDEKIEKKTTEFIESFGVAKFAIWTQLPFKCTFIFHSGVELSVFNIYNKCKNIENCKKRDMFYRNLLDKKNKNNILSIYYSYLIAFVDLKDINIDKLDYWFFNLSLKDIKYEYDNLQLDLKSVDIPCVYKNISIDYQYVHDGWSDEMFDSYFKISFNLL